MVKTTPPHHIIFAYRFWKSEARAREWQKLKKNLVGLERKNSSVSGTTPNLIAQMPGFIRPHRPHIASYNTLKTSLLGRLIYCAGLAAVVLLFVFGFTGCSQEKNTWTSLAWHNTLARYNGYFIAREKMKEFETDQLDQFKDNYNRVLEIFPYPATGGGSSANAAMEEVIKKASIPIQRHKNSKWVDDCYQLIGQARFYKEDWENAIQSFKYINTKFKDPDAKHLAVIWLLKTYTRMGDYSNARSVIAYLKKEKLSKDNLREGALAFAYYYQKRKEYQKVADYLGMAVELMPKSKQKGRLSHALGQLHQKFKHDADAFAAYQQVLRNHPSFELEFFTRVNMAQVVEIADAKQLKKIRKNFRRMTTDLKYEEYLDKVYYEMGLFEVKQNNMPKGLEFLRTSLKKSKANTGQKPYTYLKLAELHYNPLRSYVWAKNYYDSTMTGLDTAEDNYKFVAKRQKVLTEFVKHYVVIVTEDSLLKLSKMDTTQLYAMIDKKIADEADKKKKAEKAAKDAVESGGAGSDYNSAFDNLSGGQQGNRPTANTGGVWYFSNLSAVSTGLTDFKRKWGNRKLEDNWRRSSKEAQVSDDEPTADTATTPDPNARDNPANDAKGGTVAKDGGKADKGGDLEAPKLTQAQLRQAYLKDIPASTAQVEQSHAKLKVALLEIGKIYDQQLDEPELAIEALERDVKDYPTFEKAPEALYNLCLIYRKLNKQADFDRCKALLLQRHPESLFAKLIQNPNYLQENKQRNEIIAGLYRTVFEQYKGKQYIEASNGIASIRAQYPKSDFEDKLSILSALITAKTVNLATYKQALKQFLVDFPKSNLIDFAQLCLTNAEKGQGPGKDIPTDSTQAATKPTAIQFNSDLDKKQLFLAIIPTLNIPESDILAAFSDFNQKFYPGDGLDVTSLPFGDNKHAMIKVQELPSKIQAMYYLKKAKEAGPFSKNFKNLKPIFVLITQENLIKLYQTKAISEYVAFYTKNYNLNKELDDDIPRFGK